MLISIPDTSTITNEFLLVKSLTLLTELSLPRSQKKTVLYVPYEAQTNKSLKSSETVMATKSPTNRHFFRKVLATNNLICSFSSVSTSSALIFSKYPLSKAARISPEFIHKLKREKFELKTY